MRRFSIHSLAFLGVLLVVAMSVEAQDRSTDGQDRSTDPAPGERGLEAPRAKDGKTPLRLRLETGDVARYVVESSLSRKKSTDLPRTAPSNGAGTDKKIDRESPEDAAVPADASTGYEIRVRDVSANGDSTVLLTLGAAPSPDDSVQKPSAEAGKASDPATGSARSSEAGATVEVKLDANGQVKEAADPKDAGRDSVAAILPSQDHLRFLFGSGLHAVELEVGRIYELAPLVNSARKQAERPIHLRFEGARNARSARFAIVAKKPPIPSDARSPGPGLRTPPEREAPPHWSTIGEATFRLEDGLLDEVRIEDITRLGSASGAAPSPGKSLSIRRLTP